MRILGFDIGRKKEVVPQAEKAHSYYNSLYYYPDSPLVTMLSSNSDTGDILGDPRADLQTNAALVAAFPEISSMISFYADIAGTPKIVMEGEEAWADETNAMLADLKFVGEMDFAGNEDRGISNFTDSIFRLTLQNYQSFYSLLDAQGNELESLKSGKIAKIRLHDSERFKYSEYNEDVYKLEYSARGQQQFDKKITDGFKTFRLHSDSKFPWATGKLYNAKKSALSAAIIEEMQTNIYRTVGSSPIVTIFNMEPSMDDKSNIVHSQMVQKYATAWDERASELREKYDEAKRRGNRLGMPNDLTASIVGKINATSHSAADKVKPIATYPEDIKLALKRVIVAMGGIPELVGLSDSGDGLGSERASIQMGKMQLYAQTMREGFEPHFKHIANAYLSATNRRNPKYTIEWDGLSIEDMKAKAELKKIEAETSTAHAAAIVSMLIQGEDAMAKAYAEDHGLDWGMIVTGII